MGRFLHIHIFILDDENTTVEKIKDTMEGAVDVVIDFVGLPSTIITSLKVLNPVCCSTCILKIH